MGIFLLFQSEIELSYFILESLFIEATICFYVFGKIFQDTCTDFPLDFFQ